MRIELEPGDALISIIYEAGSLIYVLKTYQSTRYFHDFGQVIIALKLQYGIGIPIGVKEEE